MHTLSDAWNRAVASATEALRKGHVVAAVGESGSGRSTLLAQAERSVYPTDRLLAVRAPAPRDADSWLSFSSPELSRPNTGFVLCDVDELPDAAARSDLIDVRHLPPEILSHGEHLPRIKAFERQELVRVLTIPGISIEDAAKELGMSRATVYRKVHQYGIHLARP